MRGAFRVIPAVDLKGGRCVQLVQGKPDTEKVSLDNPLAAAMQWVEEGARVLHLVDLDGAIEGVRVNAGIIETIITTTGVEVQVGGGIRTQKDAEELLNLGVERIILGTAAMQHPELVTRLAEEHGSQHITVALDAKNGKVTTHGWTKQTTHTPAHCGQQLEKLGAGSILFTNINTEGLLQGINPQPTAELIQAVNIPIIASGGITTLKDIKTLKNIGAAGAVIGTALYLKKINLREAVKV